MLEVRDLTVGLSGGGAEIVRGVSLHVRAGEIMGVVGESGSGKSTMALALLGYARRGTGITGGSVLIEGTELLSLTGRELRAARRDLVAYVPQDPGAALNPAIRIGNQLAEIGDRSGVAELLESVGLPGSREFLRRRPGELSGGQQQRVAIAMAVAARPRLIVLDEPTTGLDVSTQRRVLELVRELCHGSALAGVYISHDLAVVGNLADRVTVLYAGQIMETGAVGAVIGAPAHPYSRALLGSVPSTRERRELVPIPGRAPQPGEASAGCRFAPRCAHAIDECRTREPALTPAAAGHAARCLRVGERLRRAESLVLPAKEITGDADAVLTVSGLNARYGARQVLFDVSFALPRGNCLAVVGESGSGKTTMARCLIGLHDRQDGELGFAGDRLPASASARGKEMQRRIQYIFQNSYGALNPRHPVGGSIVLALRHFFGLRGKQAAERVRDALERVDLPERFAQRYPAELSGGQRQRVAIARALACDPTVLICDEVTSALDVSVQASVVELLRSLCDDGLSLLFVTHDLGVVRSIADGVVVLNRGRIVEHGRTDSILGAPEHDYTRALLADTPELFTAASPGAVPG
ncbi:dipeptide ABC transporter ATP-binding protein [Sciscionella sediminilitoris]|uniref:dipeptide ABC transporter ATP-binding protein n=1 Tax=Sciscionella sediminilitoris TaxID=1445613 RepID=UPI0004DF1279|nr:ABC transporter ATP-binding protein [Sciscionella sp. SE31]